MSLVVCKRGAINWSPLFIVKLFELVVERRSLVWESCMSPLLTGWISTSILFSDNVEIGGIIARILPSDVVFYCGWLKMGRTFNRVLLLELNKSGLSLSNFIEGGPGDVDGESVVFLCELYFVGNVVIFLFVFQWLVWLSGLSFCTILLGKGGWIWWECVVFLIFERKEVCVCDIFFYFLVLL